MVTDKQRTSTRAGAFLVFLVLVGTLLTVGFVNLTFAASVDDQGNLAPGLVVVLPTDLDFDLLNPPVFRQFGCSPILQETFTGSFDTNSTVGSGTMFNETTAFVLNLCFPPRDKIRALVVHTDFTASDALALDVRAIGVGLTSSEIANTNQTVSLTIGLVPNTAAPGDFPITTLPISIVQSGSEALVELDADFIAFMATFPDHHLAYVFTDTQNSGEDPFASAGDNMFTDFTGYAPDPVSATGGIQTTFTGSLGADVILGVMYYVVGFLTFLGAFLIWPTSEIADITKRGRK